MGGLKTLACQVQWATRGRGHSPGAVRKAEAQAAGGKLPRREVAADLDAGGMLTSRTRSEGPAPVSRTER